MLGSGQKKVWTSLDLKASHLEYSVPGMSAGSAGTNGDALPFPYTEGRMWIPTLH
jgi:hypothetical protein